MIMDKEIKKLTERFMAGLTSVEEERMLAEYFRSHDVSDEWKAYKEMFAWFDKGMPLDEKKPLRRVNKLYKMLPFAAAAAVIIAILAIGRPRVANDINSGNNTYYAQKICNITTAPFDSVTADTARASEPVKKTRRNTMKRHQYSPAPPKVYLAMKEQDSINEQAALLAEEELNKIYMEQEEILQEIKRQYERQNLDIEMMMASMEEDDGYEVEENIYY